MRFPFTANAYVNENRASLIRKLEVGKLCRGKGIKNKIIFSYSINMLFHISVLLLFSHFNDL